MIKLRKIHVLRTSLLASILLTGFITSYLPLPAFGDEYTASGHRVGSIPEKAVGEDGPASILADNMIAGNVIGIEATFDVARIQEYNPVTHAKVSEFSVPCPSGSCNGRGLAFDGTNFWYSILTGGINFTGDGLIHKIGMSGGADILTIPDGYGAGGRGIGAIDFIPGSTDMLVSSYLPDNDLDGLADFECGTDDTGCLIEIKRITTTGVLVSRCDVPFDNSGGTGLGNESLVVDAASGTFLTDGGEADLTFLDRYNLPVAITLPGTSCTNVATFSPTAVGIGGIDFDLIGNLVVSSTFATGIGNLDGPPFNATVGGTFTTDTNIEDITIKKPSPGTIIIRKNTVPNDPQDFTFSHTIPPMPFTNFILDDDSNPVRSNMKTFDNVPTGSYKVTEKIVTSIPLRSIICIDPTGDSVRSGNSANIELDAGETITCTFTNGIQEAPCQGGIISEPQPEDAISMTSVRNENIVKTIHAEKQVFDCELPQGDIPVIADVTIIAEIYENIDTKIILSKQVVVVTCIKEPDRTRVLECDASTPTTDIVPVTNCEELDIQHPQEMNTIQKGNTAKTVETQKEVFKCAMNTSTDTTDDKKVDVVLFTDIFQNLNMQTSQDPQIISMKCVIKIDNVTVESCRFRTVL